MRRHAKLMAVLLLGMSPESSAGPRCTIATQGDSPVAKACARGGRDEAAKVMKAAVKAAKANGEKFNCDDCHKDPDASDYTLKPKARDDFKRLLDRAGPLP